MMSQILFLTDGGPELGMGHVYSSITIANALPNHCDVLFAIPPGSSTARRKVNDAGFELVDGTGVTSLSSSSTTAATVVNLPEPDIEVLASLQSDRVIVYGNPATNLSEAAFEYADVVVNPTDITIGFTGTCTTRRNATYLRGPAFVVLREEFYRRGRSFQSDSLDRVLLIFGGSDPSNFTTKFVRDLCGSSLGVDVDAVVGPGFRYHDDLNRAVSNLNSDEVTVSEDIDDVARRISAVDFVMTSPGLTLLESLYLGAPSLAVYQNTDQRTVYENLSLAYPADLDVQTILPSIYQTAMNDARDFQIGSRRADVIDKIVGTQE